MRQDWEVLLEHQKKPIRRTGFGPHSFRGWLSYIRRHYGRRRVVSVIWRYSEGGWLEGAASASTRTSSTLKVSFLSVLPNHRDHSPSAVVSSNVGQPATERVRTETSSPNRLLLMLE